MKKGHMDLTENEKQLILKEVKSTLQTKPNKYDQYFTKVLSIKFDQYHKCQDFLKKSGIDVCIGYNENEKLRIAFYNNNTDAFNFDALVRSLPP